MKKKFQFENLKFFFLFKIVFLELNDPKMETSNYEFDLNEELIDFSRKFQNYKYQRNENQNQFPTFVIENLNLLKVNLNNSRNNSKTTFFKNMLFACDVLIDYSWEMLNTNIWIFVDEIWRLLYGYSVLYKIILLKKQFSSSQNFAHSGSNDNDNDELKLNENIVKLCDLGYKNFIFFFN